jgi:pyruvate dehydrogenase E2 component (dihydrolipoamide acetyltransferase)
MIGTKLRGWRRLAAATWRTPDDPQYYGAADVDAAPLVDFIARAREGGRAVSVTHLLGRAVGHAFGRHPEANFRLVWGRAVQRRSVDVFIVATIDGGRSLSGVRVDRVDERSVFEVAEEVEQRVEALRAGDERTMGGGSTLADLMPWPLLRLAVRFLPWLAGEAGLGLRALMMPACPFGCAMVTNVGALGLPVAFGPLAPLYRVPLLVVAGEIVDKAVAVDGRVEVRGVLPVTATFDHRYYDGFMAGELQRAFLAYLADPAAHEAELPRPSAPPAR